MGRFAASGYLSPYSASARRLQSSADGGCFTTTRQGPVLLKFPDAVRGDGRILLPMPVRAGTIYVRSEPEQR